MRPRLAAEAFNSRDHVFELKWDGVRALLSSDGTGLHLVDRGGADLLPLVPELRELRLPEGTLLDGEVVVCDSRGRPDYDQLVGRLTAAPKGGAKRGRRPIYVAFDLLYDRYRPFLGRPLTERRAKLAARGLQAKGLVVPEHLETDGEPFLEVCAEYGLEGIVAKRRDGPYVPGARSGDWLKCPVTPRADVVIGALIEDPDHGVRTALCGYAEESGGLVYAGEAYVPPYLGAWLDASTRDFRADASPFTRPMSLPAAVRWLRPRLVAIVEHAGEPGPELRDARFRAIRIDGRVAECRPEEPVSVPHGPPSGARDRPRLVVLQSLGITTD